MSHIMLRCVHYQNKWIYVHATSPYPYSDVSPYYESVCCVINPSHYHSICVVGLTRDQVHFWPLHLQLTRQLEPRVFSIIMLIKRILQKQILTTFGMLLLCELRSRTTATFGPVRNIIIVYTNT